ASLSPRGSSISDRTSADLQCSSRKLRAEFFRSCWSDVNEKSTAASLIQGNPRRVPLALPDRGEPWQGSPGPSLRLHAVGARFLWQTEHALTDDVLLDLR